MGRPRQPRRGNIQGYTVVDPATVITTHLTELIRDNMSELLSYVETQNLLDELPNEHQKLLVKLFQPNISGWYSTRSAELT